MGKQKKQSIVEQGVNESLKQLFNYPDSCVMQFEPKYEFALVLKIFCGEGIGKRECQKT